MRPILLNIPAKALFFAALILAVAAAARDLIRRRRDKSAPWSSTPLYLLVGAGILSYMKTDHFLPSAAGLSQVWTPVPIYAYGVMLGTSLVVGWFIAMTLAKQDGIDQQDAGTIYMWSAVWSIIGSRLLYVVTNISEFDSITQVVMVNRGGLVAYGGMIGGFLASCVLLPQAPDPAPAMGGRGGAVGRARHGHHARRLPAVRLRLRPAVDAALGDHVPAGAAPPGITTCMTSGSPATPSSRTRCTRRRSTNRWSACSCSRC